MRLKTVIEIFGFIAQGCKRIWHDKHLVAAALQAVDAHAPLIAANGMIKPRRRLRPAQNFFYCLFKLDNANF